MAVTPSLKELKSILKPMGWKDRIEYLWTYYKLVLVAVLGVVAVVSIVVSSIQNKQIVNLYSGMLLNVNMQQEDREKIVDDLTGLFEGDGKKRIVDLIEVPYIPGDDPANMEMNSAAMMKIMLMVASNSLDYILTDESTYQEVIQNNPYANLQDILTEEDQKALSPYFVWREADEEMPRYPMALDISHTEFVKTFAPYEKSVYLVFVGNTENGERNQPFLDYILNWSE